MSQSEKDLRQRIKHKAPVVQHRQKSAEEAIKLEKSPQGLQFTKQASEPMIGTPVNKAKGEGMDVSLEQDKKPAPVRIKKIRVTTSDGRQV